MEDSQGPRNKGLHYLEAMLKFYRGFRKQGVNVDVIDMTCDLDNYKVLALPMVICSKKVRRKVRAIVENGGVLVTSTGQESQMILTDVSGRNSAWTDGCAGNQKYRD